jgi:hypothetical protein
MMWCTQCWKISPFLATKSEPKPTESVKTPYLLLPAHCISSIYGPNPYERYCDVLRLTVTGPGSQSVSSQAPFWAIKCWKLHHFLPNLSPNPHIQSRHHIYCCEPISFAYLPYGPNERCYNVLTVLTGQKKQCKRPTNRSPTLTTLKTGCSLQGLVYIPGLGNSCFCCDFSRPIQVLCALIFDDVPTVWWYLICRSCLILVALPQNIAYQYQFRI